MMKVNIYIFRKFCFILVTILTCKSFLFAQVPVIDYINKSSATVGETLTIVGSGFGSNPNNLAVFFGAEAGEIISCQDQRIKVKVPSGATYKKISVTNLSNRFTTYSDEAFLLSFNGKENEYNQFSEQMNFAADLGVYDLCHCDFDKDGKVDIVSVQEGASASRLSIFRNTTSANNLSFVQRSIILGTPTISIDCADIDGDGRPDVVVTRGGNNGDIAYVFKNISTMGNINFATPVTISNREGNVMKVLIRDMDGDGKPEIIWTNNTTNNIQVNINISTLDSIKFSQKMVPVQGAGPLRGLALADIDNDHVDDIIVGSFILNDVFVVPNRSSVGDFNFGTAVRLPIQGSVVEVASADFNGDGKADIVASLRYEHEVAVFTNNSTGNYVSFQPAQRFRVNNDPWGIDVGDLNGDGKPDIAVASINDANKAISLLINSSNETSLSFDRLDLPTLEKSRNIRIGDVNQDGKPDISFSSIDTHKLSFFLNYNCVVPELSPNGNINICEDFPYTIEATNALKVSYEWYKDDALVATTSTNSFEATSTGEYHVKIKSLYTACEEESGHLVIEQSEALTETPEATNLGPVCAGQDLELRAKTIEGYSYIWSGPNGFSSTEQNPVIENISESGAGEYFLQVSKDGCVSRRVPTFVNVKRTPSLFISSSNGTTICEEGSSVLSVNLSGLNTYQWFKDGNEIDGAVANVLEVSSPGEYYVQIDGEECTFNSHSIELEWLPTPEASFTTSDEHACVSSEILFTNTSTFESNMGVKYTWDFGDGSSSQQQNPSHVYSAPGEYEVSLKIEYIGLSCTNTYTDNVSILAYPEVNIQYDEGSGVCQGDVVVLQAVTDAAFVMWDTGSTERSLAVTQSGTYAVTAYDHEGCPTEESIEINFSSLPSLEINANKTHVFAGETVVLSAGGAFEYVWFPGSTLSDSTATSPVATPTETTTYFLIGTSASGCVDTLSITIEVEEMAKPRKVFSPNGDGIDDEWYIEGIDECTDCTVSVFDKAGRLIFESKSHIRYHESPWRGDYNGRVLPEGVYYYIISGNGHRITGSVLLVR